MLRIKDKVCKYIQIREVFSLLRRVFVLGVRKTKWRSTRVDDGYVRRKPNDYSFLPVFPFYPLPDRKGKEDTVVKVMYQPLMSLDCFYSLRYRPKEPVSTKSPMVTEERRTLLSRPTLSFVSEVLRSPGGEWVNMCIVWLELEGNSGRLEVTYTRLVLRYEYHVEFPCTPPLLVLVRVLFFRQDE